ncbi:MAG: MaoC family dehydratase N-terminal domain-containing protein [Pseudomonadales bacterium]|nr:MaoC family dehydratase N-terminal domain-containing protein [Pseudomonadales bacterium]
MTTIENKTIDELEIGDSCEFHKTLTGDDIKLFAISSGDYNPVHLDETYARTTAFGECIAHGMWSGALISAAIAMQMPGPGSIYRSQTIKFSKPVKVGDSLTVSLTITDKKQRTRLVTIDCTVKNQHGEIVARGEAEVIAPAEKMLIKTKKPEL